MCNALIDEALIHAKINDAGETWRPLNNGSIERKKWIALLRRRAIEAVEKCFKNGLELFHEGAILHPGNIIALISKYDDTGEEVRA